MNDLKVLVVDDESRMRKLVRDFLVKDGYSVVEAADGEEAVDVFMSDKDISLIILDVMMPKLDGYGVAEEVRKMSDVPIIMLTAKKVMREMSCVDSILELTNILRSRFSPRILVARVEAVLRRTQADADSNVISVDGIEMDIAAHQVKVDGEPIELSYKEFELLNYFLQNRGVALSREKNPEQCLELRLFWRRQDNRYPCEEAS